MAADKFHNSNVSEVCILGVKISSGLEVNTRLVSFVNPFSILVLSRRTNLCSGFNLTVLSDGILIPVLVKIFYGVHLGRFSFDFTSLAGPVLSRAQNACARVAIIGGEGDVAERAAAIFEEMFPGLEVVFCRNGYFSSEDEMKKIACEISESAVQLVLLGMGAGRQEEMLRMLAFSNYTGYAYTCGGFLDQTVSGKGEYYPKWIDVCNLRAVYRFCKEPRRLWRRYFLIYPEFLVKFLFDWFDKRFKK